MTRVLVEQIRENHRELDSCKGMHRFSFHEKGRSRLRDAFRCRLCGGTMARNRMLQYLNEAMAVLREFKTIPVVPTSTIDVKIDELDKATYIPNESKEVEIVSVSITKEALQKLTDSAPGLPATVVGEGLGVSVKVGTAIPGVISYRPPPDPPAPPLNRHLREGGCRTCPKCGSSMFRTKLIFFGKKRCIHPQCGYEI